MFLTPRRILTSSCGTSRRISVHKVIQCSSCSIWSSKDYQYLERSKVPTMHFQKSLPRLPIPELHKTCERYLKALEPITSSDKLNKTRSIVSKFEAEEGKALQDELKASDSRNKHTSYISGPWFDMYLKSRTPLVLNYNPFLSFKDDPKQQFNYQHIKATNLVISSLRFLKSLKESVLEPEVYHLNPSKSDTSLFRNVTRFLPEQFSWYGAYLFKAFPLDMSQFKNLFQSTRIPKIDKDEIHAFPESKHLMVLRNGHIYVFDVLDSDGNILPPSYIHSQITYILSDERTVPKHPISLLTTADRNTWAEVRQQLEHLGNGEALRLIDSSLFTLVLDEENLGDDLLKSAHHMLHGPVHNRWFDKCFQLIITGDGKAAINFEHSWGDGVAVLRFFNEIYKDSTRNPFVDLNTLPANLDASHLVRKLEFKLDESVKSAVRASREKHNQIVSNLQLDVLQYDRMNRDVIKNFKLSPDAIAQLGFQMGFYKMYSTYVATYESCSTSAFKHGRTETVRPATSVTKSCVEEFLKKKGRLPANELRAKLQECTRVHNQLTKEAAMGQGFDRHLFGLKMIAEKKAIPLPALYQDTSYIDSNHFTLSTSTLFGPAFSGGGFGPVVKDGFGVGYGYIGNMMGCLVSSYKDYRDGAGFVEALRASYDEIYDVLLKASPLTS